MTTKSRKPAQKPAKRVPSFTSSSYQKSLIEVPAPPEVLKWKRSGADALARRVTQERAMEITGKSVHTVRRWANSRQEIDVTSLRRLQVWVWGIIPAPEFIEAGIFVVHDQRWHHSYKGTPQTLIVTDNGYLITPSDLQSFGWLQGHYRDAMRRLDAEKTAKAESEEAAKPSAQIIPFSEYLARRQPPEADKEKA